MVHLARGTEIVGRLEKLDLRHGSSLKAEIVFGESQPLICPAWPGHDYGILQGPLRAASKRLRSDGHTESMRV